MAAHQGRHPVLNDVETLAHIQYLLSTLTQTIETYKNRFLSGMCTLLQFVQMFRNFGTNKTKLGES